MGSSNHPKDNFRFTKSNILNALPPPHAADREKHPSMIKALIIWVTLLLPLLIAAVTSARVSFRCREWPWVLTLAPISGAIACGIAAAIALNIGILLVFSIEGAGQGPNPVGVSDDNLFTFVLVAGIQTTLGAVLALIVALVVLVSRSQRAQPAKN
jgi:hypothetical protein